MDKQIFSSNLPAASSKPALKSAILRAGKRTFFFDVFAAANSKKYLKITESQFAEEGQPRKRSTFILFPEDAAGFQTRLTEIVGSLIN